MMWDKIEKYCLCLVFILWLVMCYFTMLHPVARGFKNARQAIEVVQKVDEWKEWVDNITSMETDYEKILRESVF